MDSSDVLAALLAPQNRDSRVLCDLVAHVVAGARLLRGNLVLVPLAATTVALQVESMHLERLHSIIAFLRSLV